MFIYTNNEPRPNERAATEGKVSSEVYTEEEAASRAQDVLCDGVSPETVLKDGQKLKRDEKGHSRRGTSPKQRHTGKHRQNRNPACKEPRLEITARSRRVPGVAAELLLILRVRQVRTLHLLLVGKKSTSRSQSWVAGKASELAEGEHLQVSGLGRTPESCQEHEHPSCCTGTGHGQTGQPGSHVSRGSQQSLLRWSHTPGFLGT